jgi:hypothetical protein
MCTRESYMANTREPAAAIRFHYYYDIFKRRNWILLTLLLVQHTNALDRAIVGNPLAESPCTGRSNCLGGGLTALDKWHVENVDSLLRRDPVGNSASRVVLRSTGYSELPQPSWRRRRRTMEVGKVRVWRKCGKIDNDDCIIDLNRPRPIIFIRWEDLPCK